MDSPPFSPTESRDESPFAEVNSSFGQRQTQNFPTAFKPHTRRATNQVNAPTGHGTTWSQSFRRLGNFSLDENANWKSRASRNASGVKRPNEDPQDDIVERVRRAHKLSASISPLLDAQSLLSLNFTRSQAIPKLSATEDSLSRTPSVAPSHIFQRPSTPKLSFYTRPVTPSLLSNALAVSKTTSDHICSDQSRKAIFEFVTPALPNASRRFLYGKTFPPNQNLHSPNQFLSLSSSSSSSSAGPKSENSSDNYEAEQSESEDEDGDKEFSVLAQPKSLNQRYANAREAASRSQRINCLSTRNSVDSYRRSNFKGKLTDGEESRPSQIQGLHVVNFRPEELLAKLNAAKRDQFYLSHAEYFSPLLPETNYISKLLMSSDKTIAEHKKAGPMIACKTMTQPAGIRATMKPYQLQGLTFLVYLYNNGMSGILADEMGLGKTLQTLSLIQYLREVNATSEEHTKPVLVVCPLSVLQSWVSEVRRFAPTLKPVRLHGSAATRDEIKQSLEGRFGSRTREPNFDVIFTTYEIFEHEKIFFKRAFRWDCVILDEGHKIKNAKSNIAIALQGIRANCKLILTGTPIQNDLQELWSLLHWLYPEVFGKDSEELFKASFNIGRGVVRNSFMENTRHLLELVMLRRTKESPGVSLGIPPKTEILLLVPLTIYQRRLYKACITDTSDAIFNGMFDDTAVNEQLSMFDEMGPRLTADDEEQQNNLPQPSSNDSLSNSSKPYGTTTHRKLMNILMQLRQICIHPYQLPEEIPSPYRLGEHVITSSGKFIVLAKMIDELVLTRKRKVLVFSEFTGVLDFSEELLKLKGGDGSMFKYVRFDGSTVRARRSLNIRLFNQELSQYQVMLISTMAGGLGINLTIATEVIFLDEAWNPQITLQAEARAHRIGQDKTVTVYKICTQGTVEQQMLSRIQKKLYLSRKVTENMQNVHLKEPSTPNTHGMNDSARHLNTIQLRNMIRLGTEALTHTEIDVEDLKNWDWHTMLEHCQSRTTTASADTESDEIDSEEKEEEKWLLKLERVKCAVFEGEKHSKKASVAWSEPEDLDRASRRIGKETTVKIGEDYVMKAYLRCQDSETTPTAGGKSSKDVETKKRPSFTSQQICQVCWSDKEKLRYCTGCPRTYHDSCIGLISGISNWKASNWRCPQHKCADCEKVASNAGGLLFRCRYCSSAFCEDCLDWDNCELLDDTLSELDALGFDASAHAFFVICSACKKDKLVDPIACQRMENSIAQSGSKGQMTDESGVDGKS